MTSFLSNWSGTARRLLVGFGLLVLTLVAASWLALAGLESMRAATDRMRGEEESVRLALELASAVRDQYAHQAHTIIIGDESHLGFYTRAEERVREVTQALKARARTDAARAAMDDIEAASAELDQIFRRSIVPAVIRKDAPFVRAEHARAQLVVTRIQDRTEELVGAFEASIAAARADVDEVQRRTHRWIVALLVGAPLLAAGVSVVIGRSIAGPLARLQAGAARLAAGDLETHIDLDRPDEFGALARQFNAMTAAIKEHQAQLVQSEKLAGVGRLAAGVAHEINNPLGVILGYTRLLEKRADGPLREDLAVIAEEALRCKDIVEGLLDLSRPLQLSREAVDLRATAEEVVERLAEAAALDGVEVVILGDATVDGHPSKLRQVLSNLIRNAAEAAGRGGAVEVKLEGGAGGGAVVSVRDTGPGLDAGALSRLFEPFFTTKDRGTGLGLAISRAIARAHGGEIEAGNSPQGGAAFTLRLPRRPEGVTA